jgi:hypothetical protein
MEQRYVVAVEMAKYDISRGLQCIYYILPDLLTLCYLEGMGEQGVAHISQGKSGINDNSALPGLCQTAEATNPHGFRTYYFNTHGKKSLTLFKT